MSICLLANDGSVVTPLASNFIVVFIRQSGSPISEAVLSANYRPHSYTADMVRCKTCGILRPLSKMSELGECADVEVCQAMKADRLWRERHP